MARARKRYTVRLFLVLLAAPLIASAQSQFSGKWQTKTNPAGESRITLNIMVQDDTFSGEVVLLDMHSRIAMPITNPRLSDGTLEFETSERDKHSWHWRLSLTGQKRGHLHGSVGEMLIDERIKKTK